MKSLQTHKNFDSSDNLSPRFILSKTNAIAFLMGAAIVSTLIYVVEINQMSETQVHLRESKEHAGQLTLIYQEYVNLLSPATMNSLLVKAKDELNLDQVEEFTFLKTSETQLSLQSKKYE